MAQVIPIKRDKWKIEYGKENDLLNSKNSMNKVRSEFFDRYKNMFWERKEFK